MNLTSIELIIAHDDEMTPERKKELEQAICEAMLDVQERVFETKFNGTRAVSLAQVNNWHRDLVGDPDYK
jgi:hypothetical protein